MLALLKEKGLQGKIKTIIGGASVTAAYAYAYDAANAVEKVKELMAK